MEEKRASNRKLIIVVSLLALGIVALLFWLFIQRNQMTTLIHERETEKNVLQEELDSLMTEHNKVKTLYGTLSDSLSVKDSIIQANATEIRKLLDTQYEYYKVRKKLAMLQQVAQGYVHQLDSLYTVNRELKEENERIRQVVRNEQSKNQELIRDKEDLKERMNQAAVLRAYDVTTKAYKLTGERMREQITDKANRTDKLKICFTIGENSLIEPGIKIIYVRITRPDNVVVVKSRHTTFEFNGQTITYSLREDIDYSGKTMNVCVEWIKGNKEEPAMKGRYHVGIFSGNSEIGQGAFELK